MPDPIVGQCWHCGQNLSKLDYGRESVCLACHKPTHCCRNCRHYAPGRPNECMEPLVDRILDKARANFCDVLEPAHQTHTSGASAPDPERLRQTAEDLFK